MLVVLRALNNVSFEAFKIGLTTVELGFAGYTGVVLASLRENLEPPMKICCFVLAVLMTYCLLPAAAQERDEELEPAGIAEADTSVTEISETEHINKGYVSRTLRLALIARGIIEAIFAG